LENLLELTFDTLIDEIEPFFKSDFEIALQRFYLVLQVLGCNEPPEILVPIFLEQV
jgi:hypothetical protein